MKKLAFLFSIILLVSCDVNSGRVGPPGPEGPPGADGFIGQGFEVGADFNLGNDFSKQFFFSDYNAEAFDTDVVLVYWLYPFDQGTDDDIWQQLPASVFFQDGAEMQYSFDHTFTDVQLYLTGDVDLNTVGEGYTQNQIFRIVILPVEYVNSTNLDLKNMDEVMKAVGKNNFKRINISGK